VPLHNFPLVEVGGRINCEIYQQTLFHSRCAYRCDVCIASQPAVAADVLVVISIDPASTVVASIVAQSPDPDLLPAELTSPTMSPASCGAVTDYYLCSHTDARLCITLQRLRFVCVNLVLRLLGQVLLFS
jgi:hypothetical protein